MFTRLLARLTAATTLIAMLVSSLFGVRLLAQDDVQNELPDIVVEGPVQTVNVNVVTIADIDFVVAVNDPLLATIKVGDVVRVEGDVDDTAGVLVVNAGTLVITQTSLAAPLITIRGPVKEVNLNIVTVYDFDIQFDPNDVILVGLNVGDVIEVSGSTVSFGGSITVIPVVAVIIVDVSLPDPEATPEATPDPEDLPINIVIEGPVQSINVNIITIYDLDIQVDPGDPVLTEIQIGDTIRVAGNIAETGDTIIIIAVTIIIIDADMVIIDLPPGSPLPLNCKVTKKGKVKCKKSKKGSKKS